MILKLIGILIVLNIISYTSTNARKKQSHYVGGIFSDETQELAFRIATYKMNNKYPLSDIELVPMTHKISSYDTIEAYRVTCDLLEKGIIGLFGPSSVYTSPYVQSICDTKEIPHVEFHVDFHTKRNVTLVNLHPHPLVLPKLLKDLIRVYEWKKVTILYDDEESLLSVGHLLEYSKKEGQKIILKQLDAAEIGNYRPLLIEIRETKETNFVLACSMSILEEVLKQLQQVGMMTDIYSYILTNLDTQTIDLTPFQYSGTNITALRMLNPELTEVMQIAESLQKLSKKSSTNLPLLLQAWETKLETALIFDSVELFFDTLYELTIDKNKVVQGVPIKCYESNNWNEGYTIINLMKSKYLDGLTGRVQFDGEGFRTNFIVDILELSLGGLLKIGNWNSSLQTFSFNRPYKKPKVQEDYLFNKTFIVLISITPPYQMLKETTEQLIGNDRYEGYGIDVIDELSKILGFNYTFVVQEDGSNGVYNATTGKWDGMLGEIIEGRVDLAITDLTITSERESAVDFSEPFMNLGISILYRKPEPVPPSLFMFVSPFSYTVWLMLGVAYLLVSLAVFIMGRLSPSEWQNPYPCIEEPKYLVNQFTFRNSFWFTVGALMQQGTELGPVSLSTRVFSGFWWFFVLTMVSTYTANLAAFLTVTTLVTPFNDIDELADQKEIKFGAKRKGATANYFRDSNLTKYKKIWSYMVHNPDLMLDDNDAAVRKVENENYAFLMESTTIEYVVERHCALAQVGGLLDDKGYGIAMKKFSPYRNDISKAILQLQEKGILTSHKIKWWKEKRGGGKCASKTESAEATALDLQNVGGVFLVLFTGSVLGIFFSLAEFTHFIYNRSKKEKISFKDEFKKEIKFLMQLKQNVRELNVTLPYETSSDKNLIDNKYN